jgi:hypothetical protein
MNSTRCLSAPACRGQIANHAHQRKEGGRDQDQGGTQDELDVDQQRQKRRDQGDQEHPAGTSQRLSISHRRRVDRLDLGLHQCRGPEEVGIPSCGQKVGVARRVLNNA